jgi:hypothetical protein
LATYTGWVEEEGCGEEEEARGEERREPGGKEGRSKISRRKTFKTRACSSDSSSPEVQPLTNPFLPLK